MKDILQHGSRFVYDLYKHKCDYDIKETHMRYKTFPSFDIATLYRDIITSLLDCIVVHT